MQNLKSGLLERFLEGLIFSSRWLQAPVYIGITLILFAFIYFIAKDVFNIFVHLQVISDEELIISTLTLCEIGLLANLVIIIVVSGYENFVSKLDIKHKRSEPTWIKRLKYSDVKMKIMSSILALSSVQLLKLYLMKNSTNTEMIFALATQLVFIISALVLAIIGLLERKYSHSHIKHGGDTPQ